MSSQLHYNVRMTQTTRPPHGVPQGTPFLISVLLALLLPAAALAGVYQKPADFINEVFAGDPPPPKTLWLTASRRPTVTRILAHPPTRRRIRYWYRDGRSAWILEEIGKERPITVGIVIDRGRVERVKILAFRESRGWEVRYPRFLEQFHNATLTDEGMLDRPIDGITGATLSVRAVRKLTRLALYLHGEISKP